MMNSQTKLVRFLFTPRTLALLAFVGLMAMSVTAQLTKSPTAQPPNIDQCANGPQATPVDCIGSAWQNGNLNGNQAHWIEGESVAYRVSIPGTQGVQSTITIQWDTTKGGKHALDYITTYNRSNAAADPCSDIAGAVCTGPTTFPIPVDPNVTAGQDQVPGNGDDIVQIPGVFTMFGGTINSVSAYTLSGTYAGDSSTAITITFTPSAASGTTVLSWGGHIATRLDWGLLNSCINISGSPYHMRILGTGNQDRSLSVDAVIYPARVTITKLVTNLNSTYSSVIPFAFTSSANFGTTSFSLTDNDPTQLGAGTTGSTTNSNITLFGSANTITVTESLNSYYTLANLVCTEQSGGVPAILNTTWDVNTRTATIIPDEGEIINCTFSNTQLTVTAAPASINGRVVTVDGRGIRGAAVTLVDINTGLTVSARTNSFGYYVFEDMPTEDFYTVSVSAKGYTFTDSTRSFTLLDNVADLDFVATP